MIAMLLIQAVSNLPSDASALERQICALRSSIAAVSSSVASLNSKAEFWDKWPYGFTAAVVIGVAMEWLVIRHDWREDNETWALTFFGLSRTIRPSWRKLCIEYISVALVALGVAGELAIGIVINVIDRHLRDDNATLQGDSSQLVALVTQLAGSAAQSAAKAQGAADKADTDAKEAQTAAGAVAKTAQQLTASAKQFKSDIADLSPRTFRDQNGAVSKLGLLGGARVILKYLPDAEAKRTAEQIAWVLVRAGATIDPQPTKDSVPTETGMFDGVTVTFAQGSSEEDEELQARRTDTLIKVLNCSGLKAFKAPFPMPTRYMEVSIGLKPRPGVTQPRASGFRLNLP